MKGVSIPINTLVMLAVAIIVLLAAVAWFMGAFAPTAQESSLKQRFDSSCLTWTMGNCGGNPPSNVCTAYGDLMKDTTPCNSQSENETVAYACGCTEPLGTERP